MSTDPRTGSDLDALFEPANYLYFDQDTFLTAEKTRREAQFVREHLGVDASTTLLDLACGHGRHANALARHASHVVGLDTNAQFLHMARACAKRRKISNVKFIQQDIRTLNCAAEFDRAMLLSTVFGLFDDADSQNLLTRIHSALRRDGRVCFDVVNRDTILTDFQPDYVLEKANDLMVDRLSFDARTGRMTNRRIYIRDGRKIDAPFSLRLFNFTELAGILDAAHFDILKAYGDWRGTPFDWLSKKIVLVAAKRNARRRCAKAGRSKAARLPRS